MTTYRVTAAGETIAEVSAGDGAVDELISAAEDAAAAAGRKITCVFRALSDGGAVATLTAVVNPPQDQAPVATHPELTRVIQVLCGHTQELTRLVIQSQSAILSAYQSAIRDASRRAAEAEARAIAAEEAAAEVLENSKDSGLPPAVEQFLAALPALAAQQKGGPQ